MNEFRLFSYFMMIAKSYQYFLFRMEGTLRLCQTFVIRGRLSEYLVVLASLALRSKSMFPTQTTSIRMKISDFILLVPTERY